MCIKMEVWQKITEVMINFWPAYIILPILIFFRDQIKNWFFSRYNKGAEKLEEEKFDQHAAKYEQRWTKELQLAKKISQDNISSVETRLSGQMLDLETRIETNKETDTAFQETVARSFKNMNDKLDLIQKTQNNNCENMGAKLQAFQAQITQPGYMAIHHLWPVI